MVKVYRFQIEGVTPYSQSRAHEEPKLPKEQEDAYDKRTWPLKLHTTDQGKVFIPPAAFKFGADEAARYAGEKIKGQGNKTWATKVLCGQGVYAPVVLDIDAADVQPERVFCNVDGVRGSGKRVWRWFPTMPEWRATVDYTISDEILTPDVMLKVVQTIGLVIGIGRYRPAKGGWYGRFKVLGMEEFAVKA